jgi:hypothetical protein
LCFFRASRLVLFYNAPPNSPWLLRFVVEWRLLMETDTARAVVKAIYPTIIVITVMLLAAGLL